MRAIASRFHHSAECFLEDESSEQEEADGEYEEDGEVFEPLFFFARHDESYDHRPEEAGCDEGYD